MVFSSLPAIATSSGLAAQSTIVQILKSGDHVVSMGDVYGGTYYSVMMVYYHRYNTYVTGLETRVNSVPLRVALVILKSLTVVPQTMKLYASRPLQGNNKLKLQMQHIIREKNNAICYLKYK